MRVPIITSKCESGPIEFYNNNNSMTYNSYAIELSEHIYNHFINKNYTSDDLDIKLSNGKKLSQKFTKEVIIMICKDIYKL